MPPANLNELWARSLVAELHAAGVRHAVVSPGSRSAPLALAFADHGGFRAWSVIDERSAAFFALGIGKESATPAALVCTSGTAGANFYPAVVEGAMSRVPLLVLTADRPRELQGWGALQTIPQHRLYGEFARWFVDLGLPEPRLESLAHLRATTCRAVAVATQLPRGIVHINVPFREPLAPTTEPFNLQGRASMPDERRPGIQLAAPERLPNKEALEQLRQQIRQHPRGLIVCGPKDASGEEVEAIASLSRALGYPIFAECDSQLRFGRAGADVISLYDGLLSHAPFASAHRPDVVLRFGGALISKRLMAWLDGSGAFTAVLTDDGTCADPNHTAALAVEGSVTSSCRFLAESAPPRREEWFHSFTAAERKARAALEAAFSRSDALTEPRIAREAVSALSSGSNLVVSSSMPIRDLDAFTPGSKVALRVFANRGANGIEGMSSTALGISAASGRPTLLLAGDLAFVHDLGGLLTARRHRISLTALVVNNDGGGIFSFLPIAQFPDHFEELFATPHGLDFSSVAQLFQAHFIRPRNAAELRSGLKECLEGGLHIIDARTDRSGNPAEHQKLFEQIGGALDGGSSSLTSPTRKTGVALHYETWGQGSIPAFLLHGFTGNLHSWDHLRPLFSPHLRAFAVDLPGHGSSPSCEGDDESAFQQTLNRLEALLDDLKIPQVNLLGYSLGARIALGLALRSPERIRRLVLESGNAGLRQPKDRMARKQQDDSLATEIEALGVQAFVDRWETLPLLRGQRQLPPQLAAAIRARRLACSAHGLAGALRGLGLGAQPNYWGLLEKLRAPTLAIVGAEDSKFVQIATEMVERLPQGQVRVLADCGHSPHLEQPMVYAQEVLSFLQAQSLEGGRLEESREESI